MPSMHRILPTCRSLQHAARGRAPPLAAAAAAAARFASRHAPRRAPRRAPRSAATPSAESSADLDGMGVAYGTDSKDSPFNELGLLKIMEGVSSAPLTPLACMTVKATCPGASRPSRELGGCVDAVGAASRGGRRRRASMPGAREAAAARPAGPAAAGAACVARAACGDQRGLGWLTSPNRWAVAGSRGPRARLLRLTGRCFATACLQPPVLIPKKTCQPTDGQGARAAARQPAARRIPDAARRRRLGRRV